MSDYLYIFAAELYKLTYLLHMKKKILTEEEIRQTLPSNLQFERQDGIAQHLEEAGYVTLEQLVQRINNVTAIDI